MSHSDYVSRRSERDPRFEVELQAAAAELAIGEAIVRRWQEREISQPHLAELTGISPERLEAIEAGDTLTLHELIWLAHVLDLSVVIAPNFNVTTQAPRILRRTAS
jgi:transcriptional regulator with XRE-family HTH domain